LTPTALFRTRIASANTAPFGRLSRDTTGGIDSETAIPRVRPTDPSRQELDPGRRALLRRLGIAQAGWPGPAAHAGPTRERPPVWPGDSARCRTEFVGHPSNRIASATRVGAATTRRRSVTARTKDQRGLGASVVLRFRESGLGGSAHVVTRTRETGSQEPSWSARRGQACGSLGSPAPYQV
jgi:hypothetical protein